MNSKNAWFLVSRAFTTFTRLEKDAFSAFKSDVITKHFSDVQQGLNWLGNPMVPVYN